MKRREFIGVLGAGVIIWPSFGLAQNPKKHVIGVLAAASPSSAAPQTKAISDGLRDLGYIEGRDYEIISKWAYGRIEQLPALAEELVRLRPDILIANPVPAVVALRGITTSIPIVSFMLTDEVRLGLAASDARPGSNVTGLSMRLDGMVGKQIELATQTVPSATKIGMLINPGNADAATQQREAEAAGKRLALTQVFAEVRSPEEIVSAFQHFQSERAQMVVCLYDALFFQERKRIADLALDSHLPVLYGARDHIVAGGLISYGVSLRDNAYRLGAYVDKIFKGARAAELPVEFPTKLELVINLRTAKAIGLPVPPTLLTRADEVIE
jgi:putative ABC transport system substrate-binding protein